MALEILNMRSLRGTWAYAQKI